MDGLDEAAEMNQPIELIQLEPHEAAGVTHSNGPLLLQTLRRLLGGDGDASTAMMEQVCASGQLIDI